MIKIDPDKSLQTVSANRIETFFFLDWYNGFYVRVKFNLLMSISVHLAAVYLRREGFAFQPE